VTAPAVRWSSNSKTTRMAKLNHGGDARDSDRGPQGLADSVAKID
jgi:hypothetical protein